MSSTLAVTVVIILLTLAFDFINGFHDTATAVATSISTRALSPKAAIALCAVFNFVGAFLGTEVAKTVGDGIVDQNKIPLWVIAAVILAVQIIWQNVVSATDMVYKGIYAFDIRMVILSAAMIFFSVKYIMEQFILPIYVFKKCNDTSLYCRKIHCDNLEELVRYIILEQCPYIKGVYVSEDGCIHVKGRHTLHSIIIDESGAEITSEGYDCKTKIEVNAIAKFLSTYKEK